MFFISGELLHAFAISKPTIVISTNRTYDKMKTLQCKCECIKHIVNLDSINYPEQNDVVNGNAPLASVDPTETTLILYSSGTTGLSKGVELMHRSVIFLMEAYRYYDGIH